MASPNSTLTRVLVAVFADDYKHMGEGEVGCGVYLVAQEWDMEDTWSSSAFAALQLMEFGNSVCYRVPAGVYGEASHDNIALGPAPDDAATARFARQRADRTAWTSRDAAACIALSSLLPESEEVHFTQVRTAAAYLTAIKARYSTPATVSLGRLFLPFLFPDLASFERSADLIAHLRSLDASYRAACTEAQLVLLPPPMAITVYFIATSLPDRLASVRDALLLKHPSELTIEVLESALKDVESNLRSVAAASGTVSPPLFHGCTVPQLPTFSASLATAATDATAAAVTTASRSRGRGGKKGGSSGGGGGGSGGSGGAVATGGGGSAASGETPRAAAGDSTAPAGGGDPRARQSPPSLPVTLPLYRVLLLPPGLSLGFTSPRSPGTWWACDPS
ncbi:unnamed protein product [Closterium sp. NIES-65]|nr:unnamed protein product [Closterium sp. NIES-65]